MSFFLYNIKKYIVYVAIIGIILLLITTNKGKDVSSTEIINEEQNVEENIEEIEPSLEEIHIDIKGAIADPGVYQLKAGQRVYEAIEAAGGFAKNANRDVINLALLLQDEMLLYIPIVGEDLPLEIPTVSQSEDAEKNGIKINSATQAELETLSGIGPSKAIAILNFIEENGAIQEVDDLLQISGIGEKTLDKFKEDIIVP